MAAMLAWAAMRLPLSLPLPPASRAAGVNLALAGLFVLAWLLYPKTYAFSDQAYYLIRAHGLGKMLDWPMTFYFEHRFGLLLPHWVSYRLFGVSHATSFLPQLGFLLLLLFAVLRLCEGPLQKAVAALGLLPLLPYAADARPDLGAACFIFLALCCLMERGGSRGALFGALFSLAAFYVFLVKAIAYFIALPFAIVLVVDLLRARMGSPPTGGAVAPPTPPQGGSDFGKRGGFYASAVISGLLLLAAYLAFYWLAYGDPLGRLNAINQRSAVFEWQIHGLDAYLHRFFVEPFWAFPALFGVAFLLALAQCLRAAFMGAGLRTLALCLAAGLLFVNFTPTSLADWQPLPLTWEGGRYSLFLTPAVALLAAAFVGDLFAGRLLPPSLLGGRLASGYGALAARAVAVGLLLLIACQSGMKVAGSFSPAVIHVDRAKRLAVQALRENEQAVLLLSTDRSHGNFALYTGFDPELRRRTRLCSAGAMQAEDRAAIVFIDRRLSAWLASAYGQPHCNDELLRLSRARGNRALMDDADVFLSLPRRAPGP